jgi:cell fate regulator YaaT (PSP1 superfamily)
VHDLVLVRYGAIAEVAKFAHSLCEPPHHGERLVVETHRGLEVGTALQSVSRGESGPGDPANDFTVLRRATPDDELRQAELRRDAQAAFSLWQERISRFQLELELVEAEWLLDRRKLVLYVLSGRSADATRLAILGAAEDPTVIEVQPVTAEGPVPLAAGGGCGVCDCH